MHYIQKYILDKLVFAQVLRNRDMRPPHIESNLYQYHLKQLIRSGHVKKTEQGYSLSLKGLQYADKHSSDLKSQRPQPKLVTILILENSRGEVLLVRRNKQPFIGQYNLPSGKIHEGEALLSAGARELAEKVGITDGVDLMLSGTTHLIISDGETILSESYGFILHGALHTSISIGRFVHPGALAEDTLMPGVEQILTQQKSFLELNIDLNTTMC